jgi:exodeoxyribonuclease X
VISIIRCLDFESTGLDPKVDDARVCEIGITDVVALPTNSPKDCIQWAIGPTRTVLVDPGHHIPAALSAVHHITDADVAGAPKWVEAAKMILEDASEVCLCAHHNRFEQKFFTVPAPWIDTYRVALHLAPQAPEYKLQTLRYWLKLDANKDRASPPHRAGPDTYVTALLVQRMLAKLNVAQMIKISSNPAILTKFTFGKHAMRPIENIPTGYLHWVLDNITDDEDVIATARHHLRLRNPQGQLAV